MSTAAPGRFLLQTALGKCTGEAASAFWQGLGITLLMLAAPLYMMQVYDRVLNSRSTDTLIWLTLFVVGAFAVFGALSVLRTRVLARMARKLDALLATRIIDAQIADSERASRDGGQAQGLRDLNTLRAFVASPAMEGLFDAPWTPLFVLMLFLLNVWLGLFTVVSMVVLLVIAVTGERLAARNQTAALEQANASFAVAAAMARDADAIRAMGMRSTLVLRWRHINTRATDLGEAATDTASGIAGLIKFLRMAVQSLALGLGAYLAIHDQLSAGAIIAASFLVTRALAPVEMIVSSWKHIASARDSWRRLSGLLATLPAPAAADPLARARGQLGVENAVVLQPGSGTAIVRGVSFALEPGESLGIVGPSASGKSTLARALVGAWPVAAGKVRVDGSDIGAWAEPVRARVVGYLPQEINFFPGTIGENIARMGEGRSPAVLEAARLADVHEMILRLPLGYDTPVGPGGHVLSGGQKQRIALARAFYGDPKLVVLDEPNSNLDGEGEQALMACLDRAKERGATVIVIAHRPSILARVDKILVLQAGQVGMFDERAVIMPRLLGAAAATPIDKAKAAAIRIANTGTSA